MPPALITRRAFTKDVPRVDTTVENGLSVRGGVPAQGMATWKWAWQLHFLSSQALLPCKRQQLLVRLSNMRGAV